MRLQLNEVDLVSRIIVAVSAAMMPTIYMIFFSDPKYLKSDNPNVYLVKWNPKLLHNNDMSV